MLEHIEQLENRIENLMGLVDLLREENRSLREQAGQLGDRDQQIATLREHNEQLQNRLSQLEGEMGEVTQRDEQIRDRLHGLLSKIESIESQVMGQAGETAGTGQTGQEHYE